ncbi:hypothetical protein [Singulisphaera acidiphila]|uniref:Uncharacterized protein n=1 Tax=Singulisphaera acidiphila (strain ATCC BAA-1392 / DSM 18658 / VKM B-2454 / MOB10) TaxID=886293 RepID=L0DJN1_SINAD|nr:hypothetical protein [Singulisphaera acidiphila]AGA29594.1 hypothetical protein Sinac_5447 [Singulisphaera acidiphila DSM 18658]
MIDERIRRRADFQQATSIQLADGQLWWLPQVSIDSNDPLLYSLIKAVVSADNERERLRDELALTMVLLSHNYELGSDVYPEILGFRPGDPARDELHQVIRQLVVGAPQVTRPELIPNLDRKPRPAGRWGFSAASESLRRVRTRWSLRSE